MTGLTFDNVLSEIASDLAVIDATLPISAIALCVFASDITVDYPLESEEAAKRVISRSLHLAKCASVTLRFVAEIEFVLQTRRHVSQVTRLKKIAVRPSRDPVACYAGIKRQLEVCIGHKIEPTVMDLLFPRSSLTAFYTSLSEEDRRQALDELVLVASGYVQAFVLPESSPLSSLSAETTAFISSLLSQTEKRQKDDLVRFACVQYLTEFQRLNETAVQLETAMRSLATEVREKRHEKRRQVFELLRELGRMRLERLEIGDLDFVGPCLPVIAAVLSREDETDVADMPGEEEQAMTLASAGRPELLVLRNLWSRLSFKQARSVFGKLRPRTATPTENGERLDEWDKLRRMMHLANLKSKKTISVQTDMSAFRQVKTTQVYKQKETATATMKETGTQPMRTRQFVAGLRGEDSQLEFQQVDWRVM